MYVRQGVRVGLPVVLWLLEQDVPGEVALAHPHLYDETRLQTDGCELLAGCHAMHSAGDCCVKHFVRCCYLLRCCAFMRLRQKQRERSKCAGMPTAASQTRCVFAGLAADCA
jgi:hypothetical protein